MTEKERAQGAGRWRYERLAVAAYVAIVVGASALPYYIAWRATPHDCVYTGSYDATSDDLATYLARMRAGARGEWTSRSPYAPGLGRTLTIRPFYAALGALTGAVGVPLWVGYHAARLVLGALCLVVLYALAGSVSRSPLERWAAFILASAGSGIGWVIGREGEIASWSYDLWVSELNATHSLMTNPHFPLSMIMMVACVAGVARSLDQGRAAPAAWGGAAFAFLALEHPYDDVVLAGALTGYGIVAFVTARVPRQALLRSALVFGAAALPAVVWEMTSALTDPSLAHMGLAQPVGSPWNVATGLGLLPLLAVPGGPTLARRSTLGRILLAWCLVVPLLLMLPIAFPRRMVMAWHVPLGTAAGLGLARLLAPIRRRALRGLLAVAVLALASLSTVDVFADKIRSASQAELGYRTWLPREFMDTYAWLQSNAAPRAVVLGPFAFSNFLPVYTDLCPYVGHWAETPDGPARHVRVLEFYEADTPDAWRSRFLVEAGIDWVIAPQAGVASKAVDLDPGKIGGLTLAGRAGFIEIFRVQPGQTGPQNGAPLHR